MSVFTRVEQIVPPLDGWCELPKAEALAAMVIALRPKVVVEIGVWGGRSLLPMALALEQIGTGIIIGIDPWKPEESVIGQVNPADAQWWGTVAPHEEVYKRFVNNVAALGLNKVVRIVRSSSSAAEVPPVIDLIHIDGNHGEQAYRDILRWSQAVRVGGICVLDDLGWAGGAVMRGAGWLKENGFVELYPLGTGAVYQRLK